MCPKISSHLDVTQGLSGGSSKSAESGNRLVWRSLLLPLPMKSAYPIPSWLQLSFLLLSAGRRLSASSTVPAPSTSAVEVSTPGLRPGPPQGAHTEHSVQLPHAALQAQTLLGFARRLSLGQADVKHKQLYSRVLCPPCPTECLNTSLSDSVYYIGWEPPWSALVLREL